ncbi:hypothetical protein BHM03_00057479 [Ensete ventricosum]|nr:hypothetical protein BHM03_00057479 [Ensete ventricosum]
MRSCTLKESGESKERVSVSGTLRAEALGVDVGRLTTSPIGVWLGSVWSRGGSSGGCIAKVDFLTTVLSLSEPGELPRATSSAVGRAARCKE